MSSAVGGYLFCLAAGLLCGMLVWWAALMDPHRQEEMTDRQGAVIILGSGLTLGHAFFGVAWLLIVLR